MKDIHDAIQYGQGGSEQSGEHVLATVVKTEGSAYRGSGARMLLAKGEKLLGAVSGGCLEAAVAEEAARLDRGSDARLVAYDSRTEGDLIWGTASGCGGLVQILLEPWPPPDRELVESLRKSLCRREVVVMATIIEDAGADGLLGRHLAATAGGTIGSGIHDAALRAAIVDEVERAWAWGDRCGRQYASYTTRCRGVEILVEYIPPPVSLLVVGAGDDAQPLAEFAARLGWRVLVADHRQAFATKERFPTAEGLIVSRPESLVHHLAFDRWSAAIVMTHNFPLDVAALHGLLHLGLPYLGMLGSARRTVAILEQLEASASENLHYPAGLDLGAATPAEIALAIVAEIQAVFSDRAGGLLKHRPGPVHDARGRAVRPPRPPKHGTPKPVEAGGPETAEQTREQDQLVSGVQPQAHLDSGENR